MQDFILQIMNQYGYPGIGILILVETVFPPIPSEVILTFGGFLTTCTELTVVGVILASTFSSFLGAWLLYAVGRFLNPQRLHSLISGEFCRRLGFKQQEFSDTNAWFVKKGQKAVFFGRCVPIIRSLISIPAGMARMNPLRFSLYTLTGSLIWDTVLILLGAAAGESWEIITQYMDAYSALIKIALATVGVTVLGRMGFRKRNVFREKKESGAENSNI